MEDVTDILDRLSRSKFRSGFKLNDVDNKYIKRIGLKKIRSHARDFIGKRLAPSNPKNDGHQAPFKGHPVFKAQHATATCCRKCLMKWHRMPKGRALKSKEIDFVVSLVMVWISSSGTFKIRL